MLQDGGIMPYVHEWGRMISPFKAARYERARLRAVRANAPAKAIPPIQVAIDMLNDSLAVNMQAANADADAIEIALMNDGNRHGLVRALFRR